MIFKSLPPPSQPTLLLCVYTLVLPSCVHCCHNCSGAFEYALLHKSVWNYEAIIESQRGHSKNWYLVLQLLQTSLKATQWLTTNDLLVANNLASILKLSPGTSVCTLLAHVFEHCTQLCKHTEECLFIWWKQTCISKIPSIWTGTFPSIWYQNFLFGCNDLFPHLVVFLDFIRLQEVFTCIENQHEQRGYQLPREQ